MQLLGATSDAALKFAEDVFEYEKRIARVTPEPGNLTDPVANFHKIQVSHLRAKSNTVTCNFHRHSILRMYVLCTLCCCF